MLNSNATSAASSDYEDGLAFCFKLPREDLSLRAVDIKDGVPKLRFTAALKVPTITEEDVAMCIRLCLDNKRPEFFYMPFHSSHPFAVTGRHYKYYKPAYLRGTSVGELLAELDWKMKCLDVGVRSDKKKEKFWSWKETSNLEGLATREDFFEDLENASVIMNCKSIDVDESDNELFFVGEPKMGIDILDKSNSNTTYSKYITNIFDSVAYYDEPLFLAVKEIVKLILAVEWLKEKGVSFSRTWINELTSKPTQPPPQPIQVKVSDEEAYHVMEQLQKAVRDQSQKQLALPNVLSNDLQLNVQEEKVLDTGFQLTAEATFPGPCTGLDVPVTLQIVIRATFDNYDMLLDGLNPNIPVSFDSMLMEPIVPNVDSWNELFCQTIPHPCFSLRFPGGLRGPPITGGISTSSIPQNTVKREKESAREVAVSASRNRKRNKPKSIPAKNEECAPQSNVGVKTWESSRNSALARAGVKRDVGYTGNIESTLSTGKGNEVKKTASLKTRMDIDKKDADGKQVGKRQTVHGEFSIPLSIQSRDPKGSPMDSGVSSMVSTPQGSPPPLQGKAAATPGQQQRLKDDDVSSLVSDSSGLGSMMSLGSMDNDNTLSRSDSRSTIQDEDNHLGDFDEMDGDGQ